MTLRFEWDSIKARINFKKHGVSFEKAATVFGDSFSVTVADPIHSVGEERFITIGQSRSGIIVVVAHTDKDGTIRIISARRAMGNERRIYEEK